MAKVDECLDRRPRRFLAEHPVVVDPGSRDSDGPTDVPPERPTDSLPVLDDSTPAVGEPGRRDLIGR